jgi:hypothetical protein
MRALFMATITLENNSLVLQCRYDAGLVAALKTAIPYTERRFDPARKVWVTTPNHAKLLAELITQYLGEMAFVPDVQIRQEDATLEILDVRYIGACKERGQGISIAYGWSNEDWTVVFPEDVLRIWFEGIDMSGKANHNTTLYGLLGAKQGISQDDIKTAYRRMAKIWHPDISKEPDATERFKRINEAFEVLSNPLHRAKYDAGLILENSIREQQTSDFAQEYRAPLKCGLILVEAQRKLGRFHALKIVSWNDIINSSGQMLVSSWPFGASIPVEKWI